MFQRIVVPLDGSRCAEHAIPVAARLARAAGGSIVFVQVVLPPVDLGKYAGQHTAVLERKIYENKRAEAARYLAGMMMVHARDLVGIDIDMGVTAGIVPQAICAVARSERADLIVISSPMESRMSRWFFGDVAQEVSRRSTVPVLVLHERGGLARPLRVVVALDGSPLAETAISPAVHLLALLTGAGLSELHLLHVVELPATQGKWRSQAHIDTIMREEARQKAKIYLQSVAEDVVYRLRHGPLAESRIAITWSVVLSDDVVGTIIQQAERGVGDGRVGHRELIVMATRGRGILRRLVKGSVSDRVFGATRLPLLLVRQ